MLRLIVPLAVSLITFSVVLVLLHMEEAPPTRFADLGVFTPEPSLARPETPTAVSTEVTSLSTPTDEIPARSIDTAENAEPPPDYPKAWNEQIEPPVQGSDRSTFPKVALMLKKLESCSDWEEFYSTARDSLLITPLEMQDIIIRRVAREIGLDAALSQQLHTLIESEQAEVTDAAVQRLGPWQAIRSRAPTGSKRLFAELKEIRGEVRDQFLDRYSSSFSPNQLKIINRHLRNERISLVSAGAHFFVGGVGEKPNP